MAFFKKQLLKVIEWQDSTKNTMVYRFPMSDRYAIMKGSQLIVREGQVAIFMLEGIAGDVFWPGRYKLESNSLPILTKLKNWKYAFENPYQGEVYFLNTKQFTNQKWGTTNPIMMRDKDFGVIRLRGFGVYSFRVSDPTSFMRELFGTNKLYTVEDIENYLKKIIISRLSDTLAESKIAALDLATKYDELGAAARQFLQDDFAKLGLELSALYIENLSLPPEVEKTLDTKTSMGVLGDMGQFTQYQAAHAIRDAASNPSGGFAGAGVGLGAGAALGGVFMNSMNNAQQGTQNASGGAKCSSCGATMKAGAKFCPECGAKQGKTCPKCGASITRPNAKFCPECGTTLVEDGKRPCKHCGAMMPVDGKFCPECGKKG